MVNDLVKDHGLPDLILHSPYYRCRQTAKIMKKTLEKYHDHSIEREVDPRLGRYFTKKQKKNPDIKRSTRKKGAIIEETRVEFKEREGEQLTDNMEKYSEKNIWLVTHSLVLIRVAKIKQIPYENWVGYLDNIIIQN